MTVQLPPDLMLPATFHYTADATDEEKRIELEDYLRRLSVELEEYFKKTNLDATSIDERGETLETDVGTLETDMTAVEGKVSTLEGYFKTGDWMVSSVATARTGWTDVSATYNNKFIRLSSGTPLSTGGTDTHTHARGSFVGPSHTHARGSYIGPSHIHTGPSHTHTGTTDTYSGDRYSGDVQENQATTSHTHGFTTGAGGTGNTGASGTGAVTGTSAASGTGAITGTSASADNIPAYVLVRIFQKDA